MKVLKIFAKTCSNDGHVMTLTFLWQSQICFPGFHTGGVYGIVENFGTKIHK